MRFLAISVALHAAFSLTPAVAHTVAHGAAGARCLDGGGSPVDWFFVYKRNAGTDYAYVSSDSPPGPLTLTGLALDDDASPVSRTLQQLVDGRASLARVQWNDELPVALGAPRPARASPPKGPRAAGAAAAAAAAAEEEGRAEARRVALARLAERPECRVGAPANGTACALGAVSGTSGHTKGVLAADGAGGFFFSHTLPKFPTLTPGASMWGGASTLYGQNFLCLSLDAANVEAAALALQYDDPRTYDSAVPAGLNNALPNTVALVAGQRREGTRATQLATAGGAQFTQFSKSGSTGVDIYEDVLQPAVKSDMWVETWLRAPVMDTYCRPLFDWNSQNVRNVTFVDAQGDNVTIRETQDHVSGPVLPAC